MDLISYNYLPTVYYCLKPIQYSIKPTYFVNQSSKTWNIYSQILHHWPRQIMIIIFKMVTRLAAMVFFTNIQISSLEWKTPKEFSLWDLTFPNLLRFSQFHYFYLRFKYIIFVETLQGTDFKFTYLEFGRPVWSF